MSKMLIDRRKFHAAIAASVSACCLSRHSPAKDQTPDRLNYILASPMYGTEPLANVLPHVRRTGAAAIDIWPRSHANHREQMDRLGFDKVAKLLAENQVQLGVITRYDLGPFRITEEIPTLKRFEGSLLICGAGQQPGETIKERVHNFLKAMKPHIAIAEQQQVKIGIENHSNTVLSSPDSIRYFAELNPSPSLGLAMAPYHLPQDPQLISGLIEQLGDRLAFFQAWQHGKGCMKKLPKEEELLQMPGRGDLDFCPILAALQNINYQGWTEIFMHPVPRGIPILDNIDEVTAEINRSRAYLNQCFTRC